MNKVRFIIIAFLFLLGNGVTAQEFTEKEYIALIVDIERNDVLHPRDIFYWIADADKLNQDYRFDFVPLFLKLFYSSDAYEDCCKGQGTTFYTFTSESEFLFKEDFEKIQEDLKIFLKKNSKKIQTIKKKWNNGFKEKITISATPINAILCNCEIKDKIHFQSVFLPTTEFKLNLKFWEKEISRHLITDYSNLHFIY